MTSLLDRRFSTRLARSSGYRWRRTQETPVAPASGYLRAYRLIPARASFRPATVRHLLTHTSGAPETLHPWGLRRDFGQGIKAGQAVPSLAEYQRKGLRLDVEPGTRYRYTDHGFATLGDVACCYGLAAVIQQEAAERARERPLNPRLLLALLHNPRWLAGSILGGLSSVIQGLALAFGPLTLVLPLASSSRVAVTNVRGQCT